MSSNDNSFEVDTPPPGEDGEIASVVTPIQATTSSEDSNLVVPHKETQSESEFTFRETVFVQKGVHIPPRDIKLGANLFTGRVSANTHDSFSISPSPSGRGRSQSASPYFPPRETDKQAVQDSGLVSVQEQSRSRPTSHNIGGPATPGFPYDAAIVTGRSKQLPIPSENCLEEAKAMVSGILKSDTNYIVVALVVANDNCSSTSPPLNSAKASADLKSAFERCGFAVIPVLNRTKEYLSAVLQVLADRVFPKSCVLFWFLFTGHGENYGFFVNNEHVRFEDVIWAVEKIKIENFAFFFECCQLRTIFIKACEVPKQHMIIYSAPPCRVSFHFEGVGLLVHCLVEMLKDNSYQKQLNDLQQELRQRLMEKMSTLLRKDPKFHEFIAEEHLPVYTSNMCNSINFYEITSNAMKPSVTVTMADDKKSADVEIKSPKRIIHHSTKSHFELDKYIIFIQVDDDGSKAETERIILKKVHAKFTEEVVRLTVPVKKMIKKCSGKLIVAAKYKDEREEYSEPFIVDELPHYDIGEPHITEISRITSKSSKVTWCHEALPTDEAIRDNLIYKVVEVNKSGKELGRPLYESTDLVVHQAEIERRSNCRIKVGVQYKGHPEFKCIYSDIHEGSDIKYYSSEVWNYLPVKGRLCALLALVFFILALCSAIFLNQHSSFQGQLIVANQTISLSILSPSWLRTVWYKGVRVSENITEYSDNPEGLLITSITLDPNDIRKENSIVIYNDSLREYSSDKVHSYIPENYLNEPIFLLKGSVIEITAVIYLPSSSDVISSATIYIFNSFGNSKSFHDKVSGLSSSAVEALNILSCVNKSVTYNYTIPDDSYYFFVFDSDSDSKFIFSANFTFLRVSYINGFEQAEATGNSVITKNNSAYIPFGFLDGKVTLLYAHPLNDSDAIKLVHLDFYCVPRNTFRFTSFSLFLLLHVLFILLCIFSKFYRKFCQGFCANNQITRSDSQQPLLAEDINEHTSLSINS